MRIYELIVSLGMQPFSMYFSSKDLLQKFMLETGLDSKTSLYMEHPLILSDEDMKRSVKHFLYFKNDLGLDNVDVFDNIQDCDTLYDEDQLYDEDDFNFDDYKSDEDPEDYN